VILLWLLSSCAASLSLAVGSDGSGTLAVDARIPDAAAARLRSYGSAGSPGAALFDTAAVRRETARRGLAAVSAETPSPNRFRGSFSFRSLADLAADPELAEAGILRAETRDGVTTLSFRLSRDNARSLPLLFPGLDPYFLEALSPPALDPYPVTTGEYREMLQALLGTAALGELESAEIRVQVRVPGPVVRHAGGSVSDRTFTAALRLMDVLVLEKPLEFSVAWR
jgi:hypothetical protein